jgi:hypothetical protein
VELHNCSSDSESEGESVYTIVNKEKSHGERKSLSSIKRGMCSGKYASANKAALSVTQCSSDKNSSIESFDSDKPDLDEIITEKFYKDHSRLKVSE